MDEFSPVGPYSYDWMSLNQMPLSKTTQPDIDMVGDMATKLDPDWAVRPSSNVAQSTAHGLMGEDADQRQAGAPQSARWSVPDILGGVLTTPFRAIRALDYTVKRGLGIAKSPESQLYNAREALSNAAAADPESASRIGGLQAYLNSNRPTASGVQPKTTPPGLGYGDVAQEWLNVLIPGESEIDKARQEGRGITTALAQLQGRATLPEMLNTVADRGRIREAERKNKLAADLDEKIDPSSGLSYAEAERRADINSKNALAGLRGIDADWRGPLNKAKIDALGAATALTGQRLSLLLRYGGPEAEAKINALEALTRMRGVAGDNAVITGRINQLQLELDQQFSALEREGKITGQGLVNEGREIRNGLDARFGAREREARATGRELSNADAAERNKYSATYYGNRAEAGTLGNERARVDIKQRVHDLAQSEKWDDADRASKISRATRPTGTTRASMGVPTFAQYQNARIKEWNDSAPSDDRRWENFATGRRAFSNEYDIDRAAADKANPLSKLFGSNTSALQEKAAGRATAYGLKQGTDYTIDESGALHFSPDSPEYRAEVLKRTPGRAGRPTLDQLQREYFDKYGEKLQGYENDRDKVSVTVDPLQPGALDQLVAAAEAVAKKAAAGPAARTLTGAGIDEARLDVLAKNINADFSSFENFKQSAAKAGLPVGRAQALWEWAKSTGRAR